MTTPPPPRSSLILGWVICLAALFAGLYWFFSQSLQNNAPITRGQIWAELPELLAENFGSDPSGQSGWNHLPERFDLLAVAAGVLLFAWGWGRTIVRRVIPNWSELDAPESLFWSFVAGIAVWGTITLLLGLLGLLRQPLFLTVGALPVLWEFVDLWKQRSRGASYRPDKRRWNGIGIACSLAIAPFLLAMLLGSLQPPNDFDVKEYHLEGAKEHFLNGRVGFLSHNVYTSFPFLTEMLCLSGMVLRGDWFRGALAGQAVLAMFAPLTALGIFLAARRWLGSTAAWFAVLVHLSCPWIYRISIIAYAEGGLACFLFAAFLAAFHGVQTANRSESARWTFLAGVLSGAAAGCKYPGVLTVVIPVGFALVVQELLRHGETQDPAATPRSSRFQSGLRVGLLFLVGTLLTFGPWLAKNIRETGNPVYPLVYSVFGGTDWDVESHTKWQAGHPLPLKEINSPSWIWRDTRDRLWDVFLGSDWQSGLYLGLFGAVTWTIIRNMRAGPSRANECRMLGYSAIYAVYLFLSWQYLTHRIDRFWVPMLPVLSLLAGAGVGELWQAVTLMMPDRSWEVQAAVRGLVALPIFATVLFNLGISTSAIGGNNSYLKDMAALQELVTTPTIKLIEGLNLKPSDKVLFVGEAAVFDARFRYEYNTVFDRSIFEDDCSARLPAIPPAEQGLRSAEGIRQAWKSRGITHVVVNWSEILRYRTTYRYTDFVHPRRFAQLIESRVLELDSSPAAQLLVPWEKVASEKRDEVERWAPELRRPLGAGASQLRTVEVYRVVPAAAAAPTP